MRAGALRAAAGPGLGAVAGLGLLAVAACQKVPSPARDVLQEAFRDDALSATEARGHRLFLQRCATCHGPQGRGDGQNAYNLDPPPPDFQVSLARLSVAERRRVIEGGTASLGRSPLCPPRRRALDADQVDALLAWLEVASRPSAADPAAPTRAPR